MVTANMHMLLRSMHSEIKFQLFKLGPKTSEDAVSPQLAACTCVKPQLSMSSSMNSLTRSNVIQRWPAIGVHMHERTHSSLSL